MTACSVWLRAEDDACLGRKVGDEAGKPRGLGKIVNVLIYHTEKLELYARYLK